SRRRPRRDGDGGQPRDPRRRNEVSCTTTAYDPPCPGAPRGLKNPVARSREGGPGGSVFATGETTATHSAQGNGKGVALRFLAGTCGLLGGSCGRPELPRRDADEALEVMGELALVTEAGTRRDLCQGEGTVALQEVLGSFDAAQDDVLVRRQPGGGLELAGEVVGAEAGGRRHLIQGRAGVEVFLDVLDDGAEPPPRQRPVPP